MSFTAVAVGKQPNVQDTVLSTLRRTAARVTVFLINGFQLRGVITAFDPYVVVLVSDGKQQIIYKHAISTITPERPVNMEEYSPTRKACSNPTEPCQSVGTGFPNRETCRSIGKRFPNRETCRSIGKSRL